MKISKIILLGFVLLGFLKGHGQVNAIYGWNDSTQGLGNILVGPAAGTDLDLTISNVFIGANSGVKCDGDSGVTENGSLNVFVGDSTGAENTLGGGNCFLGFWSGKENETGNRNTFVGYQAGEHNETSNYNTFVGMLSGEDHKTGDDNVFLGKAAGGDQVTGAGNTFVGTAAGYTLDGNYNTCAGSDSGTHAEGDNNIYIGSFTGEYTDGDQNLMIGYRSGKDISSGSYNTFIGNIEKSGTVNNTVIIADGQDHQRIYFHSDGKTGINLGNNVIPQNTLEIKHGTANNSGLRFTNLTNSSTTTTNPGVVLSVNGNGDVILVPDAGGSGGLTSLTAGTNITLTPSGSPVTSYTIAAADTSLYNTNGTLGADRTVATGNNNLFFDTTQTGGATKGKVYIGTSASYPTTSGNYKLYVEGGILTEKVKVATRSTGNWADYVFNADYKLQPLSEVESFIKTNKHLPNIPSAETLVKEGLDLADMQAKQMEKIEELTLYAIEQDKKLEAQQKEIDELKAKMTAILNQK